MIESFKHKGLQELFEKGKTSKLPQERLKKISKILAMIHSANEKRDLNSPGLRFHELKPPLKNHLSLDVSGNYRVVFQFENGKATGLDYLDTH
jgi:proteic killer suppression protein